MTLIKKVVLYALALAVMTWETLIYRPSKYLFDRLSKVIVLREVEAFIKNLSPIPALCSFIVVVLALLPFKLLAVLQFKSGNPVLGMLSYVGAKVIGGFLITRLFDLTEPAIRKIKLVNFLLTKFFEYKTKLVAMYKSTSVYKTVHLALAGIKIKLKGLKSQVVRLFKA